MATPVIMPKFGMTQEDATVVRWLRQEGDRVEQGDPLLEVETDKTIMEVESPAGGTLAGITAQVGQVVPVTTVIAHILADGEALPAVPPPRATPVAARRAAEAGIDVAQVPATEPGGRVTRQDVEDYLACATGATEPQKPRATPAARRLARERGIDLAELTGSGPRGRIQSADVPSPLVGEGPGVRDDTEPPEVIPLAGMRRRIATRLQASYQTAPHIMLTVEADMTAAQALRGELSALAERAGGGRVSLTAVLVKVCAWALRRHRWLNASLRGDEIHLHRPVNVGVAVALEEGLIVPVIRAADRLGIGQIAAQLEDLAERARQGRLTPDDVTGGTFTISNLGMFGVDHFTAIINPPESAILAVGRVAKRTRVVEREDGDQVVIRPLMNMTLSVDHRIVDGAAAARFLQDVVRALEHPGILLS